MHQIVKEDLEKYLWSQYKDIFTEKQMKRFINEYVNIDVTDQNVVQFKNKYENNVKILDVGCGFGSFVIVLRNLGISAFGIDIAPFEIEYSRQQLRNIVPNANGEETFIIGDGSNLPYQDNTFDVITLWNVMEHVKNERDFLQEVRRVLKPGGDLYILCPNYCSFRKEAHYQVPWIPLMPRKIANLYLQACGKAPYFFETSIFYRTNWGIIKMLKGMNMEIFNPITEKLTRLDSINNLKFKSFLKIISKLHLLWVIKLLTTVWFFNPFKSSVYLYARKGA